MKLLAIVGVMPLLGVFGGMPAVGQDCGHHDHYYGDCWECDHGRPGASANRRGWDSPSVTAALETLEGKVAEVVYLPGTAADNGMVEIRILSSGHMSLIRLAPSGFLKRSSLSPREGDAVSITGFGVSGMEGDLIVATEIHKGDRSLTLRDTRGRSVW